MQTTPIIKAVDVAIRECNDQLEQLRVARQALLELGNSNSSSSSAAKPKRFMSAAARARISAAQRARWAVWKRKKKRGY
jgi:hypothetical protein